MNLEELLAGLEAEAEVSYEGDFDAPESGAFPPQLYPGRYHFTFKLMADQGAGGFDKVTIKEHDYLTVIFSAEVQKPDQAEPVKVNYQRANFYKDPAMQNSDGVELLRCLGIKTEDLKPSTLVSVLTQADGRAGGDAVFGWEAYSKDTQERITTTPRRKPNKKTGKTDIPWPKGADGKYEMVVKFPESGDSVYGRERIVSYKLPSGPQG